MMMIEAKAVNCHLVEALKVAEKALLYASETRGIVVAAIIKAE